MGIKSNFEKALLRIAYLVTSRNSQRLTGKFPKLVCFSFDYIGNYINIYGRYENSLLEKLREIIMEHGDLSTALDIGANIGNHTVFFSEFFRNVIAIEPNPRTYSLLEINTALLNNVSCLMVGASSSKATLNLCVNELNMGDSRITSDALIDQANNTSTIAIEVSPIDAIDAVIEEEIGLIKIDVQGHEADAIRGMRETLRRNKPIIAFEQEAIEIVDGSSETIIELRMAGYEYFYSVESRRSFLGQNIPSFIRIPLEILSIVVCGDGNDSADFLEIQYLDNKQYNMLVASTRPLIK